MAQSMHSHIDSSRRHDLRIEPVDAKRERQLRGPQELFETLRYSNSKYFHYSDGIRESVVQITDTNSKDACVIFDEVDVGTNRILPMGRHKFILRSIKLCYSAIGNDIRNPSVRFIFDEGHRTQEVRLSPYGREQ